MDERMRLLQLSQDSVVSKTDDIKLVKESIKEIKKSLKEINFRMMVSSSQPNLDKTKE